MSAVGFEPTRIAPPELESGALDRSAKLTLVRTLPLTVLDFAVERQLFFGL